jgi:hypothetical protein
MLNVVGLFGTCGNSKWREDVVIPALDKAGGAFFHPGVSDLEEGTQKKESKKAAEDRVC